MLFFSSPAAVSPRAAGMRRFLLTSGDTGHDEPFSATSCVVSTRSRKVISPSASDAGCGRGRMLSPPRKWSSAATGTLRSTQGIGVAGINRFVVAVKDFPDDSGMRLTKIWDWLRCWWCTRAGKQVLRWILRASQDLLTDR